MFDNIDPAWERFTLMLYLTPVLVFLAALMLFSCAVGYWLGTSVIK